MMKINNRYSIFVLGQTDPIVLTVANINNNEVIGFDKDNLIVTIMKYKITMYYHLMVLRKGENETN